jgi:SAM-dependent methyltransferase
VKASIISPEWFASPLGAYLLEREQAYYDRVVADIFGFYAIQIGLTQFDFLRNSRIPGRIACGQGMPAQVLAEPMFLPFESQSVDLLVMPHVLEYTDHPHQVLREAERVLRPEGRLVLSGFNPRSLWGVARALKGHERGFPWNGHFLNMPRVKDWLALLGFELAAGSMCCYRPPINREAWLKRFRFMEPAGDRWWAMGGGVYFLQAIKRVHGMRVLTPAWKATASPNTRPSLAARKILDLTHYRTRRGKR